MMWVNHNSETRQRTPDEMKIHRAYQQKWEREREAMRKVNPGYVFDLDVKRALDLLQRQETYANQ